MRFFIGVFLLLAVLGTGCRQDIEKSLGLQYPPPVVPEDLPEQYVPERDTKAFHHLRNGEKSINLKDAYREGHRYGWDMAVTDWRLQRRFRYSSRQQFLEWDDFRSTKEAMWLGYSEAKRQIEAATNPLSDVP